ncbi:MAG TPA: Rrf2 family transcriptional regulator [Acidimicrobiales bacterium]|nr:Rrf2 family transcriptional regulator [Acidimicrobiales bacterium]
MRISHRVDYGVRVMVALARAERDRPGVMVASDALAAQDSIPPSFLDDILRELRNADLVRSRRGTEGGWALNRPSTAITVADIIRALEGPLASVRGLRPDQLAAHGFEDTQTSLWVAVRVALRSVLEAVAVSDLASNSLPPAVVALLDEPDAWSTAYQRSS